MQIVGKIISDFGHDVYGVYCDSLFERCVPKESRQIRPGDQEAGQRVCESCRVKAGALVAAYNLKRFRLDLVIDDGVRAEAKRAVGCAPMSSKRFQLGKVPIPSSGAFNNPCWRALKNCAAHRSSLTKKADAKAAEAKVEAGK